MFDSRVLGPDRARLTATCLNIAAQHGATTTADPHATAADLDINLGMLPSNRLRHLLDALGLQIRYNPRRPAARVDIRISALLQLPDTDPGLHLELPAGWPVLNPPAARALLRLLIHVAERREHTARQQGSAA